MGAPSLGMETKGTVRPFAKTPFKGAFERAFERGLRGALQRSLSLGQLRWGQDTEEGAWTQALT